MYGYVYSYSYGKIGGAVDLSLYKFSLWNPITNIDGTREIVNEGTANNLTLYSGSGTSFNGTNQRVEASNVAYSNQQLTISFNILLSSGADSSEYIVVLQDNDNLRFYQFNGYDVKVAIGGAYCLLCTLEVNTMFNVQCAFDDGVIKTYVDNVLASEISIPNFEVGTFKAQIASNNLFDGTLKDLYIFNRALTQAEIIKNYEQPEQFYIDALTDDTCVLNMPMNDKDGFARDMSSYSDGSLAYTPTNGYFNGNSSNYELDNTTAPYQTTDWISVAGDSIIYVNRSNCDRGRWQYAINGTAYWGGDIASADEKYIGIPNGADEVRIYYTSDGIGEINEIKEITSGIHPKLNYTTDQNISNLQYGTQDLKLPHDDLGLRDGTISNYIKGDGVGIAKIPTATRTTDIELVVNPTSLDGNVLSGGASLPASGLTLNTDNTVNLNNQTITSEVTLLNGFKGTLKSYKETEV